MGCTSGQGSPAVGPPQGRILRPGLQSQAQRLPSRGLQRRPPSHGRWSYGWGSPSRPQRGSWAQRCDCPWLQAAPTLPGCSAGAPPPERHSLVQACGPSPGRFRERVASVRGRQGPSFTAEESRLNLGGEGRDSGRQQGFSTGCRSAPASGGWGGPADDTSGPWRGVQIALYQRRSGGGGVGGGAGLVDLLKLHVHHRPPIFTWTGFPFGVRGLEGLRGGG